MSSLLHLIHRAGQVADALLLANTQSQERVTPRQLTLLRTLADSSESLNQTDLVEMTGIDRSTLGIMLESMVGRGLVKRETCRTDRRANIITLTPRGLEVLSAVNPAADRAADEILSAIPASQRASFVRALNAIVALPSSVDNATGRQAA